MKIEFKKTARKYMKAYYECSKCKNSITEILGPCQKCGWTSQDFKWRCTLHDAEMEIYYDENKEPPQEYYTCEFCCGKEKPVDDSPDDVPLQEPKEEVK